MHLKWLNETTLLLADSIASIWIFSLSRHNRTAKLAYSGRLDVRGTIDLWPETSGETLKAGNTDKCVTYRFEQTGEEGHIENVGSTCHGFGRVQQILSTAHRSEYVCCTNTTASVIDEAGNIVG